MSEQQFPRIGVGVILNREGKILFGKRIGSHGKGTWSCPGGHLEFGETIADCAAREVREETGLILDSKTVQLGPYTEDPFPESGKHYITLYALAPAPSGQAQVMEPEHCSEWRWCDWHDLPSPLFPPIIRLRASGFDPFHGST